MLGKGVVAAVVCGHCHNRSRAVTRKYIVAYVDRYLRIGKRVDGITACEYTRYAAVGDTLALRAVLHHIKVGVHFGLLLGRNHATDVLAFGCQHHKRNAEDGVRTGGEDSERLVLPFDGELHLSPLAASYPVALRLFEAVRPVDTVKPLQQARCVGTDTQVPLAHHALFHGVTAAHAQAFADLVIRQYASQGGAPVHFGVGEVGDTVLHQPFLLLLLAEAAPCGVFRLPFGD